MESAGAFPSVPLVPLYPMLGTFPVRMHVPPDAASSHPGLVFQSSVTAGCMQRPTGIYLRAGGRPDLHCEGLQQNDVGLECEKITLSTDIAGRQKPRVDSYIGRSAFCWCKGTAGPSLKLSSGFG